MRFKRLALAASVLLAAGLAAIAIAVHYLDPRSLAASLAASVKADTGRELSLGAVEVRLLPRPALVLSDFRFANAPWGSQAWLARAGRASADIDLRALLSRRLRIKRIEVADASVFLETDASGNANWEIGSRDAGSPAWLESLQIDGLSLQSLGLAYRNGVTGKTTSAQLDSAKIEIDPASARIHLNARGTFAGTQVEAAGTLGILAALFADAPDYPVDLDGKVGEASVGLHGTIGKPRALGDLKLALSVQAPQFAEFAMLFGASVPALGPLRGTAQLTGAAAAPALSAVDATLGGGGLPEIRLRGAVADARAATGIDLNLTAAATRWWRFGTAKSGPRLPPFRASARLRDARQGYRVDDLELKIADSTVSASLQVAQGGPRLRIAGKAASPLIDLARLAPETGAATAPAAAAGSPRATRRWNFADVDLELNVGRLVFPGGRELRSGGGRLALEDGRLTASALQATLGGARVTLDGSVAEPQDLAGLELGIALQGGELAELFSYFGTSIPPVGAYQGRARMHGAFDALRLTAIDAQAGRAGQSVKVSGQIEDVIHGKGIQLAITANISDSAAAGRLFGAELPRLPALRATARLAEAPGGYAIDDLKLALNRTSMQGRVAFARAEPRPRITADLSGPLVDLSELPPAPAKAGGANPLLAADVEANVHFDRVVLRDRRALGPVSGGVRLAAGAIELKQFAVAIEGTSAILEGRIGDPLTPAALELMVSARVADGAGLAALTGLRLKDLPAFTVSGRLTDVPQGFALAGVKLVHAATTISGDLAVTRGGKRFKVSAKAGSPVLDVEALMPPSGVEGAAKPKAASARAIPDLPLPLDELRLIDADLDLRFEAVKLGAAAPLGPLIARAVLADGRLNVEQAQLAARADQSLILSGTIDAAQGASTLRVDGKGIDFGEWLARLGHAGVVTGGNTELGIQLQGRGKSLAAILGSLGGHVRLTVGPNRVHNFAINPQSGLLAGMFALANPFQKTDPDTEVKCVAISLPVRNGIVTSERNIAIETAKYNVVASGTVNLRTERVDIVVTPVVRSEAGTLVRVGGTLAAPTAGLDAAGAARSAASLGVAVAMPAWLIADALIKKAVADPNPCATALAAAVPSR